MDYRQRQQDRSILFRSRPPVDLLRPVRPKPSREDRLAFGRARTAVYRQSLDHRREPETATIAAALLAITLRAERIDLPMNVAIGRALDLLEAKGFSVARVKDRLRKLRGGNMTPVPLVDEI